MLLTDGGWLPDGGFRHLLAFDSVQVETLFRAEVLRLLVARSEISEEVVDNLLTGRHDARGESVARWDVLEFLARVLDHLPDPGQQLLRYWGWYGNAARGRREHHPTEASAAPRAATDPDHAEHRQRRPTWLWPQSHWGSQLIPDKTGTRPAALRPRRRSAPSSRA